jgi:hypothetical protein
MHKHGVRGLALVGLIAAGSVVCCGTKDASSGGLSCPSGQACTQYTMNGQACLPTCNPAEADAGAGPSAGGCASGSVCVATSPCCDVPVDAAECNVAPIAVCCPLTGNGEPNCGGVTGVYPPVPVGDGALNDAPSADAPTGD